MSPIATDVTDRASEPKRIEVLFDKLAELMGQRNAIDARVVDIVAEIDGDGLWGSTGCRSIAALVAWKTGCSPRNAETIAAVSQRREEFPRLVDGLREGRFSLDQVGVIAEGAADGSDEHYALMAETATVSQLRTAVSLAPKPDPKPKPEPTKATVTRTRGGPNADYTTYKITLPRVDAAKFDAALDTHHEALRAEWLRNRETIPAAVAGDGGYPQLDPTPPSPTLGDAFMAIVEGGWDLEAQRRPHGQHTTVIAHLDVDSKVAGLHLGPLLSDDDRRFLLCDATCEVWFERNGTPIGFGRSTRTVGRRLRRMLERRDHGTCVVPGCGATRGLHAHHVIHWEDGGPTELWNLVLAQWWWYQPFQPKTPPTSN